MFASIQQLVDAHEAGKTFTSFMRMLFPAGPQAGCWGDLAMSTYYSGTQYCAKDAVSRTASLREVRDGIYYGETGKTQDFWLERIGLATNTITLAGGCAILYDSLMFYPDIDMDQLGVQTLSNPVTLPRYTDGAGVQMFLVATTPAVGNYYGAATSAHRITYTDSLGASRTTKLLATTTNSSIGACMSTGGYSPVAFPGAVLPGGPFIPLAEGSAPGVRSVQSFEMVSGTNVGSAALVLCKPIAQLTLQADSATSLYGVQEDGFLSEKPLLYPIKAGACLNLLMVNAVAPPGIVFIGWADFVWN